MKNGNESWYEDNVLRIDTPPNVLHELAQSPMSRDRLAVASHPKALEPTLVLLSHDPLWNVRWLVARNSKCPDKVLSALVGDEEEIVRAAVAVNPTITQAMLLHLSKDDSMQVRCAALWNKNVTTEILQRLSTDDTDFVRERAIEELKKRDQKSVITQCETKFGDDWDKPNQGKKQEKDNNQKKSVKKWMR